MPHPDQVRQYVGWGLVLSVVFVVMGAIAGPINRPASPTATPASASCIETVDAPICQEVDATPTVTNGDATTQTISTPAGLFTVPGIAYIDGRDLNASPALTVMSVNAWDAPARSKKVCSIRHGTSVKTLAAEHSPTENRYYFQVDSGSCQGWVPETFIATQAYAPVGDQMP